MHRYAVFWSLLQDALNEVGRFDTQLGGNGVFASLHLSQSTWKIATIEWQVASQQRIQNDAATPNVCLVSTVLSTINDLRRSIMRASAGGIQPMSSWLKRSHTEVSKFDIAPGIQQYILRLQIPMTDVEPVAVSKSCNYLSKQANCLFLR
jgi:hypothetical protein